MTDQAPSSPRLDALLTRLRHSLVRQVWAHGLGTMMVAAGAWLLFAFLADRFLHLPAPIRVFHTLVLVGLPLWALRRELLAPLRRVPRRDGLAMMLERVHPQTSDVLVSAVQLAPRASGSPAGELIQRVVRDAEALTDGLDVDRVLDRRGPRRRLAFGSIAAVAASVALLAQPALTGIYLRRMLGADVRWPQRTYLTIEIPAVGDRIQVVAGDEEIVVRAARGSDVPVLVTAEGVVPREVLLHFDSGHRTPLTSGGTSRFHTLLRSVQEDLTFSVSGGDDEDGVPLVHVQVLQPPDVGGIAWSIEPPPYSGLPASIVRTPDIEVLQGSRITVFMLPDPLNATGTARLLPEGRDMPLTRAPFPQKVNGPVEPEEAREGLSFEFIADLSLRVSFELTDDTGLPNPDPGLFGVTVIEDRRPEVLLLAPGRADMDVVAQGAVPLRVRVEDDYGLASLAWDVRSLTNPDEPLTTGQLEGRPIVTEESRFGVGPRWVQVAGSRIEIADLGGAEPLAEGAQITLQVFATDNREPQANESPSAPVRLRVVSGDEYLRRMQDNLARASEQANRLYQLGDEKLNLTREIVAAAAGDEPETLERASLGDIGSLVHGARRVQGDARALARDLAGLTEGLLYSRIDDRAGLLLEAIETGLADSVDRSFHPEPWRDLASQYRTGRLGQADLAGDLVEIVGLSLEISENHLLGAALALAEAQDATGALATQNALTRASQAQAQGQEALDQLLVKLGEWDNFQSVLTLTRDILNRQKNLNQRTRKYAEDN